ncbi:MAG: glycosyltransferase 87 family protein, partial [Candidatus Aminicenantia bacterium]
IKPYTAILLPYFLLKRKFKIFIFSLLFIFLFFLFPFLSYGFERNFQLIKDWLKTIFSSTPHLLISNDNVSIMGMFSKWLGIGSLSLLLSILTVIFLVSLFIYAVKKGKESKSPEHLEISILLIFIPLFSPQGWDYVFLLSLPAIMILVNNFSELPRFFRVLTATSFILVGLTLFDIMGRRAYEEFMRLSVITIAYFVIISSLFYLRIRKIA